MTQRDVALAAGVGERFVVELERGKERCELGRALKVARSLGLSFDLREPSSEPTTMSGGYDIDDGGASP
jgi:hypothetical protein